MREHIKQQQAKVDSPSLSGSDCVAVAAEEEELSKSEPPEPTPSQTQVVGQAVTWEQQRRLVAAGLTRSLSEDTVGTHVSQARMRRLEENWRRPHANSGRMHHARFSLDCAVPLAGVSASEHAVLARGVSRRVASHLSSAALLPAETWRRTEIVYFVPCRINFMDTRWRFHGSHSRLLEDEHINLRKQVCRFIRKHKHVFEPLVDNGDVRNYVRLMRKNGEWGGSVELQ
ncbi:MAG: hypothetical protein MHM6MM_000281 [Cercozoa sp. M6MM]